MLSLSRCIEFRVQELDYLAMEYQIASPRFNIGPGLSIEKHQRCCSIPFNFQPIALPRAFSTIILLCISLATVKKQISHLLTNHRKTSFELVNRAIITAKTTMVTFRNRKIVIHTAIHITYVAIG